MPILAFLIIALLVSPLCETANAESLSTCDEIRKAEGTVAYLKCVAKQPIKNYVPGGGSAGGMLLDEMDTAVSKTICEDTCEGHGKGEKIGECTCNGKAK